MRLLLRFFGFLFAAGTIVFVVGVGAAAGLLWHFSKDLPDYSQLKDYEPPVMTRVHAADGSLLAEYAARAAAVPADPGGAEARRSTPSSPPRTRISTSMAASISAASRAPRCPTSQNYGSGRRPQGASTITQQVAKNFLLTTELTLDAQDQGSDAGAPDRAHLLEGQDPRALPQRDLSRPRLLRRRRRRAQLFRQVGATS